MGENVEYCCAVHHIQSLNIKCLGLVFRLRCPAPLSASVCMMTGRGSLWWGGAVVKSTLNPLLRPVVHFSIQSIHACHLKKKRRQERGGNGQERQVQDVRRATVCLYTSLEPWLVQEEKLSYSESLREPTGSAPGLLEKLEEDGSSTLPQSSMLFPALAWQSPLRPPKPVLLLWFSLFRDSRERSREPGCFPLTGVLSRAISFCTENRNIDQKKAHSKLEVWLSASWFMVN